MGLKEITHEKDQFSININVISTITNSEITSGRGVLIYLPNVIEAYGWSDVNIMPTEFSPKETTRTAVFFKVPDKALNDAEDWYLTFEDVGGLVPFKFQRKNKKDTTRGSVLFSIVFGNY